MNQILDIIIEIVALALSTAILCLFKVGFQYVMSKTKSEKINMALQELQCVLEDGIGYVEQTMVRVYKEQDCWDTEMQKAALGECIDYVKNNLTDTTLKLLAGDKENIEDWRKAKIEAQIQFQKIR